MNNKNSVAHTTPITSQGLSQLIAITRQRYKIPAIAVSVMSTDSILLQIIQGTRIVNKNKPATLDDYFHIGSCSKSVLAIIAQKFTEDCKITWQTTFFDIYPELKRYARGEYLAITLEDLFLCKAGIQPYTSAQEAFPDTALPEAEYKHHTEENSTPTLEFLKHLIQQPPSSKFTNGKFQHLYSNASYTMACAMLERVSGDDYADLIKKVLNKELNIKAHIGWPNLLGENQPWGHVIEKNNVEAHPPDHNYTLPSLLAPAGDLSLTPIDFAKYTQLNLQGLIGTDNYITSTGYKNIHFSHKEFSLGVANGYLAGKQFSAFDGSAGTFFCRSVLIPNSNFALTIMMNASTTNGVMIGANRLTVKIIKQHFNWWWKFWL